MNPVFCLAILGLASPSIADTPPPNIESPPAYPAPGSNLPGPFTAINVNGPKKGLFHCLISGHNLDPGVIVFVKGTQVPEGLKYLLIKLEEAVQKNVNIRLGGFVVFYVGKEEAPPKPPSTDEFEKLRDAIEKLTREDDRLDKLRMTVDDVARDNKLDAVKAAFAPQANLAKYKIDDKTDVTVVLYDRFRVAAVWSLKLDQMTEDKAKEIRGEMAEKLGAKR